MSRLSEYWRDLINSLVVLKKYRIKSTILTCLFLIMQLNPDLSKRNGLLNAYADQ